MSEFEIHENCEFLKYLKDRGKWGRLLVSWVEFIKSFPCVSKYKRGKENNVAEVISISRSYVILATLNSNLLSVETIKGMHVVESVFTSTYVICEHTACDKSNMHEGILFRKFREDNLCMPKCSI